MWLVAGLGLWLAQGFDYDSGRTWGCAMPAAVAMWQVAWLGLKLGLGLNCDLMA